MKIRLRSIISAIRFLIRSAIVVACAVGFWIALKLGWWRSLALFILTEIILIVWIHDSLLINIILLIYPLDALRDWQTGKVSVVAASNSSFFINYIENLK